MRVGADCDTHGQRSPEAGTRFGVTEYEWDSPRSRLPPISHQLARVVIALVLAGRRGPGDPLAAAAGVAHRALVEVDGTSSLERVVGTLARSPWIQRTLISIDQPEILAGQPDLSARISAGEISLIESASSPSRSVLRVLRGLPPDETLLVTTADHALLSVPMLDHFLSRAHASGADLAVGLVTRSELRARFPESRRTYLPFRGESYSGANLFAFLTPRALRAAEFWTRAERFRKRPWRLVSAFGPLALLLFLLRRLDVDAAFERASRVIGARVTAVKMPYAEAAVDIDKLSDLELVNRILAERHRESGRDSG